MLSSHVWGQVGAVHTGDQATPLHHGPPIWCQGQLSRRAASDGSGQAQPVLARHYSHSSVVSRQVNIEHVHLYS